MSELIPLSSIPSLSEYDSVSPKDGLHMSWNVDLPGSVDTERVLIDAQHLRRVQKIASFQANHVSAFHGQTTEYDYTIRGINNDGTGIIGAAMKANVPDGDSAALADEHRGKRVMENYFNTTVYHTLNKTEMAQNVVDLKFSKGISSEQAWARELDNHLQESMKNAAAEHLLSRSNFTFKAVDSAIVGTLFSMSGQYALQGDFGVSLLFAGLLASSRGFSLGLDSLRAKDKYGETFIKHRRLSLFEDMQPDRYLAMSALMRVNSLVKVKK